jgi:hypothetical protein
MPPWELLEREKKRRRRRRRTITATPYNLGSRGRKHNERN